MAASRVLMIEDNQGDVTLLSEAFAEARVEADILVAENAVQAYSMMRDLAEDQVPKLVLIDVNLPIIKGPSVLREVRDNHAWKRSHAVVLSSSSATREVDECLRLGAEEYIVKPARFDDYIALARHLAAYLGDGSPKPLPGRVTRFPPAT